MCSAAIDAADRTLYWHLALLCFRAIWLRVREVDRKPPGWSQTPPTPDPPPPRLNLPSTDQRLIRDETVSSFSVNWIPQHLFPSCLVPRCCTSVVQVKFSRVFEEFVTWGGDAESDRVATEILQRHPWVLISLWSSAQRCCPIGSSRHPAGRCSTCGGAS